MLSLFGVTVVAYFMKILSGSCKYCVRVSQRIVRSDRLLKKIGLDISESARFRNIMRIKADFHSVQNVARSTFSERCLLNYKQSSGTNLISCG